MTKKVQSVRLRLRLGHAFSHGVGNGSNPTRGEPNCLCEDPPPTTAATLLQRKPPGQHLFTRSPVLLTEAVCLQSFGVICSISSLQTGHLL